MNHIIRKLSGVILFCCITINAFAEHYTDFSMEPLTDPALVVALGEYGEISYKLVNHSVQMRSLKMKPMPGVIQESLRPEHCKDNIQLNPGASCILKLVINPAQISDLKESPILCDIHKLNNCVQPKPDARMSLRVVKDSRSTLSVEIKQPQDLNSSTIGHCFASNSLCTLVLFQSTDTNGDLIITNTSSVPARFVKAYGLPAGVSQDASGCTYLAPGTSCDLRFFPGAIRNAGTSVTVRGTNTPASVITMQVLGIGDIYAGNPLFELPTLSDLNFFTASSSDATGDVIWPVANATCVGNSQLPEPAQLESLYQASNCNLGPIGGFNCSDYYWGVSIDATNAYARLFNSGGFVSSAAKANTYLTRCTQGYVLLPI